METKKVTKEELASAITVGIEQTIISVVETSGKEWTPAKKAEMSALLKMDLVQGFKQEFQQAGMSRQDAATLVDFVVNSVMARY